jgi:hypothetical protein
LLRQAAEIAGLDLVDAHHLADRLVASCATGWSRWLAPKDG